MPRRSIADADLALALLPTFYLSPALFFGPNGPKIGATGFEPAASWSQTRRSTKLSYAPVDRPVSLADCPP